MSSLPGMWIEIPLADFCNIVRGGSPRPIKSYLTDDPNGINWIKIGDAPLGGKYVTRTKEKIKPEGVSRSRLVSEGDFILSNSMSFGRPYIMRTKGCVHDGWLVLTPDYELVDQDFLFSVLGSPVVFRQLDDMAAGVTVRNLNIDLVKRAKIPLPPLEEQKRIVAKLDSLTAQRREAAAALARVETLITHYKAAVLSSFFRSVVLGHDTDEGVSIGKCATTIFDGPFGSNLKSADYSETGERVVRLENVGHLRFLGDKRTYIPREKFQALARHQLQTGDIIFSSFIADEIRVCRLPDLGNERAINKADCFCIRVDEETISGRFLELLLASPESYGALERLVHGATRPRINTTQLKSLRIALPPLNEQREIVACVEAAFAQIETLTRAVSEARVRLKSLDRAILNKAFRGDLVPQDPNDEPASELLKRVKETAR